MLTRDTRTRYFAFNWHFNVFMAEAFPPCEEKRLIVPVICKYLEMYFKFDNIMLIVVNRKLFFSDRG